MKKTLDSLDIKILDRLDRYGPRNTSLIAKKLGVHPETVRSRLKRLTFLFSTKFHVSTYHTYIGLKKAFVLANSVPGFEEVLFECMKANGFWLYVGRCYGRGEGCYAIYGIPIEHVKEFREFVHHLEISGIARDTRSYWSTCLHTVNPKERWFDHVSNKWNLPWQEWIEEIPRIEPKLPPTLKEPKDFPIKADDIDVFILAKMEVDATIKLKEIAKMLNMTPEAISYHYKNHILKRGLIEKPQVLVPRFDKAKSDFFVYIFRFDSEEKMARFASSLLDKPFVYGLGKIIGENAVIAHICLPKREFRRFIETLSVLIRRRLLKSYEYVIEDFKKANAQTISYEYFKNGEWIYNHEKHVENLKKTLSEAIRIDETQK